MAADEKGGSGGRAAGDGCAPDLRSVVEALCGDGNRFECAGPGQGRRGILPARDAIIGAVDALRSVLFPGYFGITEVTAENRCYHVGATLDQLQRTLQEQIWRGLCFNCTRPPEDCRPCEARAREATLTFLGRLPAVRRMLATDVRAAYEGDPAATSPDETIFCYPGLMAITNHRLAHELYALGVPLIPRLITEHAHAITGIDIHPGAQIGESFFIDHGTGVVIGETSVIGARVRLYQGVTLGARSFPLDEQGRPIKGIPRHPIVEDDVIIYSGATILGRVTIGKGAVIGGNVWLISGVPAGSHVAQDDVHKGVFVGRGDA
jgi:serine O-acetyltransferase